MQLSLRGKKQHQLLGWLLIRHKPELAQELLGSYSDQRPTLSDAEGRMIGRYYSAFVKITYQVDLGKPTNARRLFIGAMIRIYHPGLHQQPADALMIRPGLVSQLARVTLQKEANVSTMIRQVLFQEKVYDDFREQVDLITQKLLHDGTGTD